MKYYNGDQKNGKTLRDIQNIKINRKLPNIYIVDAVTLERIKIEKRQNI
jgi:hypothetical protein